jgi:hypothetical protein
MGLKIQNIDEINLFFEERGCKLIKERKDNFGKIEKKLRFADDKWFLYALFSEYQKRGNIVTGKHYDAINKYKS